MFYILLSVTLGARYHGHSHCITEETSSGKLRINVDLILKPKFLIRTLARCMEHKCGMVEKANDPRTCYTEGVMQWD